MTQFIKLRGLPFSATDLEVLKFLEGLPIWDVSGINLTLNDEGRPSGEALIRLEAEINPMDLNVYNGRYMGNRFIEVFPSSIREYGMADTRKGAVESTIIRMRGIPFDATKEDIYIFFDRLMIARDGVGILVGPDGIPTGEAFVQFMSKEDANMALQRHNQCIRSRYIELYKSSMMETTRAMERQYQVNREELMRQYGMQQQMQQPPMAYNPMPPTNYMMDPYYQQNNFQGPMRRGGSMGGRGGPRSGPYNSKPRRPLNSKVVHMRGLPYTASDNDVHEFFSPLSVVRVDIIRGSDGKASGEAEAEFQSEEDAHKAMEKDRCKMSWRYIELFIGDKK